jgi:hypothetical protein
MCCCWWCASCVELLREWTWLELPRKNLLDYQTKTNFVKFRHYIKLGMCAPKLHRMCRCCWCASCVPVDLGLQCCPSRGRTAMQAVGHCCPGQAEKSEHALEQEEKTSVTARCHPELHCNTKVIHYRASKLDFKPARITSSK